MNNMYTNLEMQIIYFDGEDVITSSKPDYTGMNKSQRKAAEREYRRRREEFEEDLDEYEGIEDADF